MYIAHKTEDGREQSVKDHLLGTAKLAEEFSLPDFKPLCYSAGLFHDLGKYGAGFQKRIKEGGGRIEHSIQGAMEYEKLLGEENIFLPLLEYCIAGHHSGLPDGGAENSISDNGELQGRMKRKVESYDAYKSEITLTPPDITAAVGHIMCGEIPELIERYAFLTRYVFSCLTDADYIDTERFCSPDIKRGAEGDFKAALKKVEDHLASLPQDSALKRARSELMKQACDKYNAQGNVFILNMPTGSGKTLCSIRFALKKAIAEKKERIIYVIPYTSIIEQTAEIFKDIFGDSVEILQHHSNYAFDDGKYDDLTSSKLKRASENWDAKVIVTTSVQFFESMYHYRSSRLRKLHNMASSVIVFDEIHLIPREYFKPCMRGIGYLTKHFDSSALFLSATMPDYEKWLRRYITEPTICNLITDKSLFSEFGKCRYQYVGEQSPEQIAVRAAEHKNTLIIVNSRRAARELYQLIEGEKYHLSTYMCPKHRSDIIAKIKSGLSENRHITVISTSLIEAGVDLDFSTVYREITGLDSILQAGGRCNREGKLDRSEAVVNVFSSTVKIPEELKSRASITADLLKNYENVNTPECIEEYFRRYMADSEQIIDSNSISNNIDNLLSIPFRTYAESFKYIADNTLGVVVPYNDEARKLIAGLPYGGAAVKRKLQKYTIPLRGNEIPVLSEQGVIADQGGVFVLCGENFYDSEIGILFAVNCDDDCIA